MEIVFYRYANKTHFHKKGCAASLILKARVFGSRKWPIRLEKDVLYRFLFFFFFSTQFFLPQYGCEKDVLYRFIFLNLV